MVNERDLFSGLTWQNLWEPAKSPAGVETLKWSVAWKPLFGIKALEAGKGLFSSSLRPVKFGQVWQLPPFCEIFFPPLAVIRGNDGVFAILFVRLWKPLQFRKSPLKCKRRSWIFKGRKVCPFWKLLLGIRNYYTEPEFALSKDLSLKGGNQRDCGGWESSKGGGESGA